MTSNYDIVRDAIANKKIIVAEYQNHTREMCPHVIGLKNGREQALFYQFGGHSSSGKIVAGSPSNWRCLPIDGLSSISVRDGTWYTAGNHSRTQSCIDWIDVEVSL